MVADNTQNIMNRLTTKALELLVAISMTEKETLTNKLAGMIERYREDPEKSEEIARLIMETIENFTRETSLGAIQNEPASKSDIGVLMMEITRLRQQVEALKGGQENV